MQEYKLVFDESGLQAAAESFLNMIQGKRHFAFYGGMGVGKTTFITKLCELLKTNDLVSSPTFAIINEYTYGENGIIYHFDFYRINEPEELLDIGFYDYCIPEAYIFIEWPEKAENIIPEDFTQIILTEQEDGKRMMRFSL